MSQKKINGKRRQGWCDQYKGKVSLSKNQNTMILSKYWWLYFWGRLIKEKTGERGLWGIVNNAGWVLVQNILNNNTFYGIFQHYTRMWTVMQSVTVPRIFSGTGTSTFFRDQFFPVPGPVLFSGIKFFRYRYFFPELIFFQKKGEFLGPGQNRYHMGLF